MTRLLARTVTRAMAIWIVGLVALTALAAEPRRFDVGMSTPEPIPAPRSAPAIPTAEAPDPVTGVGSGTSASGTQTRSGAPDNAEWPDAARDRLPTRVMAGSSPASGAPLTRPAIPGRGGVSEADPTPGPVASASRPAGGSSETLPSRRPTPTKRPARLHLSPNGPTNLVVGLASWYCQPGRSACTVGYEASCTCAAAGPALRAALGPSWRGRVVTVSTDRASVPVRLVDFCACGSRVLDLFAYPFAMLAPLSAGLVDVEVSW